MNIKLILFVFLLFLQNNIQAQETDSDSLWNIFLTKFDRKVAQEREFADIRNYFEDSDFAYHLSKSFINSAIEKRAVKYLAETFKWDTLVNVREFTIRMMKEVTQRSNDSISRKIAIHYILDTSLEPGLHNIPLSDFDDSIKQKIMRLYTREVSEEVLFLIETATRQEMKVYYNQYDKQISDSINKYNHTKSYDDIREEIYQSKKMEEINKIINAKPTNHIITVSGQLHLKETIPYLTEYANNCNYKEKMRERAIFALATMRVEDYEDRAVAYFDTDDYNVNTQFAEIINSQKIWYAYINRLKSEKYVSKCPVAYYTINDLTYTLKDFPRSHIRYLMEPHPDIIVPIEITPLVPEDCGDSHQLQKTHINPEHIKYVVDWMEANKGKYELKNPIERTF